MSRFYFVHLNMKSGSVANDRVEAALSKEDWARLRGGELYIVYSSKTAKEVRDLIQPILSQEDHVLVGEFSKTNHSGWLSKTTADWLKRPRA